MIKTNKPKISDSDSCKIQVAECKAVFQQKGIKKYVELFVAKYPEYDNIQSLSKLTSVFQLRKSDKDMTRKIQLFTKGLK